MRNTNPSAPYLAPNTSIRGMMQDVLVALLPAYAMSVFLFGWWSLVLGIISVGSE